MHDVSELAVKHADASDDRTLALNRRVFWNSPEPVSVPLALALRSILSTSSKFELCPGNAGWADSKAVWYILRCSARSAVGAQKAEMFQCAGETQAFASRAHLI